MAVNLATKYEGMLEQPFTHESLIKNRCTTKYKFTGAKTIVLLTAVTQALGDYTRSGSNRFGNPTEVQDTKQELTLSQDKAFSLTVDKGNLNDQAFAKETGKVVKAQMSEQNVPFWDKYSLGVWAAGAPAESVKATLDKDTVYSEIVAARKAFVNNKIKVSEKDCTCYISASNYALLLDNPKFVSADKLNEKLLTAGVVGACSGFLIVEVPDDMMPANTHMLFTHREAAAYVRKLSSLYIRNDAPGIDGALIEGREYGDAFVIEAKKGGIFKTTTQATL